MSDGRLARSWPFRAQGDEKLVQLVELLGHAALHPGDGLVESLLRGIELVQDEQCPAALVLEGHRGHGSVATFLIRPDEARVRYHVDIAAEELHGVRGIVAERDTVPAADADTGCRFGEIAKLRWSEVDLDGQALRLADSKTGASVRPLGQPAADILEELAEARAGEYVLPGARDPRKPFGGLAAVIEKTMAAAGLDGVTAHTLRHSFASVAGDLDFTESTIGVILGHSSGSTTSRYVHRLDAVLIAAANKIAGEVHRQMTGAEGKVVHMPKRRRTSLRGAVV